MSSFDTKQRVAAQPAPIWMADKVVHKPIDALRPYARNNRIHKAKGIARLRDSIAQFGFVVPVLVDGNGTIIAGHGRWEAARANGLTTVPVVVADHLSNAQVRALRIADNKLAELSDWNEEALRLEFSDLLELGLEGELDFDLTITGFETPEIDLVIGTGAKPDETDAETVAVPDASAPTVTRPGDLWLLGQHRLFCGDALDAGSYEIVLNGEQARMVFTDPPYNVPINGHVRSGNAAEHREFAMASGEMTQDQFRCFLADVIDRTKVHMSDGGIFMVCMDWRHVEDLIAVGKSQGFELINLCVWNKTNGGMGSLYRSKHELVCIFRKPGAPHINNVELGRHGRNRTNVWDYAGVNSFGAGRAADLVDHPTVKPTALVADAIMDVTHRGDAVLDCFGGSGSTLLAAEKTGRNARLIELDPLYVDVAIRRWQEMTGQQAIHAVSGQAWDDWSERMGPSEPEDVTNG